MALYDLDSELRIVRGGKVLLAAALAGSVAASLPTLFAMGLSLRERRAALRWARIACENRRRRT